MNIFLKWPLLDPDPNPGAGGSADPGQGQGAGDPGGNPNPAPVDPGNPDPAPVDPGNPDPGPTDPGNPDPGPADPGNPDPAPGEPFFQALPDDWRSQLAGEDEKKLNLLGRYNSITDVVEALQSAREKISKGIAPGLPENPTDEQIAEYRAQLGVPESPDQYEIKLEDGLQLGDMGEESLKSVLEAAHKNNVPADAVNDLVNTWVKTQQQQLEKIIQQDGLDEQQANQLLKESWGGDYEVNMNLVTNLVNRLPENIRESFANARMADGKALMNTPEVLQFFADLSREINPLAGIPGADVNPGGTVNEIIEKGKAMMRDEPEKWHSKENAPMREKYLKALEYQQRNQ